MLYNHCRLAVSTNLPSYVKLSSAAVGFIAYSIIQLYLSFRKTIKWQCEGFFMPYLVIYIWLFGSAILVLKAQCVTVENIFCILYLYIF